MSIIVITYNLFTLLYSVAEGFPTVAKIPKKSGLRVAPLEARARSNRRMTFWSFLHSRETFCSQKISQTIYIPILSFFILNSAF